MTLERGDSPLAGRRPAPLRSVAALSTMNSMNQIGSVGSAHGSVPSSSLASLGPMPSMSSIGPMSKGGSVGQQANTSAPTAPASSLSQNGPVDGRNSASFWLELKGVERWFDTLEPHERMTLMASLYARSPEPQLHQFSSTIDKALRNQPSGTNLSRFGVGQKHSQNNDMASVYRYRSPLSAGASTGSVGTAGSGQAPSTSSAVSSSATGTSAATPSSEGTGIPAAKTGSAKTPSSVRAGPSGPSSTASQAEQAGGYVSPLSFPSTAHSTDLYSQAFLPLPRTQSYAQGYSPWGTEIRRPNSAAADAWPDTTRNSPTLSSVSGTGSPNISNLSLDTPLPFGSLPNSSTSAANSTTSPIGHPLKPWRTFTPHQNPIGGGIGLAPDSSTAKRHTIPHSSPSSPPSDSRSSALSSGLAPGSVPLSNSATSSSPQHHLSECLTQSNDDGSTSSSSNESGNSRMPFAAPANSSNPNSLSNSRAGSVTPKDNRMARRTVNIVDVELLSDIGAWLRSLRLHKYTGNLSGMRWQDVIQLTDQDLEDRGVNALGARRKLLKMFEEIRMAQEAGQLPEE